MDAFEELGYLGRGAFGEVTLMRRKPDGLLCAVKKLGRTDAGEADLKAHRAEVNALQALQHPCILRFYESIEDQKFLHLVTEYADGGDLQQLLRRQAEFGQTLEALVLLALFAQLAAAVAHVHERQVLHRDLKPSNVMLTKSGLVKLGDFGVAKVIAGTTVCEQMTCVGSPTYMAPEVVGGEDYGAPCDVWSLGVILYELCTLKKPFEARSLGELVLRISSGKYLSLDKVDGCSQSPTLSALALTVTPLLDRMLTVEPKRRAVAVEVTSNPLLTLFSSSTSSSSRCIAEALQASNSNTAKLDVATDTAKVQGKPIVEERSQHSIADDSLSISRASSLVTATRLSASLTQPFDLTTTSKTLPREHEEKAAPLANSLDPRCVREALDGILADSDTATKLVSDDTLLKDETQKSPSDRPSYRRRSTAPTFSDTVLNTEFEQPTLDLSEGGIEKHGLSGTAAFVADLRAALVTEPASDSTPKKVGVRQRMTSGLKARCQSIAKHPEEIVSSCVDSPTRSGSSTPPGNNNSRGHFMNAARSVLAAPGVSNSSGRNSEHEKSSTWPVAPAQVVADQKAWKSFAGRPTTPESIRRQRQDREELRAMQKSAVLTIPFVDGERHAPPASFLESIHSHDVRQRTRRKTQPLDESSGDMVNEQHAQNRGPAVQRQSSGRKMEDLHVKSSTTGVRTCVPTIHAPPATRVTLTSQKAMQCNRRSRSTSATVSPGMHASRGQAITG